MTFPFNYFKVDVKEHYIKVDIVIIFFFHTVELSMFRLFWSGLHFYYYHRVAEAGPHTIY